MHSEGEITITVQKHHLTVGFFQVHLHPLSNTVDNWSSVATLVCLVACINSNTKLTHAGEQATD